MSGGERQLRVEAGGIVVAVTELGKGPPLALLHGFTGSAESMESAACALAPRFRTLRFDLIGHGASEAPRAPEPYSMRACCAQLRCGLEALHVEDAHWLGYSMGGRTALALATLYPGCVRSLLLVGASAGLADPAARARRRASDEALAERIEREGLETFVDAWIALPLFASQKRRGEDALAAARAQRLRNRVHGLANSLRGMGAGAQPSLHDELAALERPVCLVVGEEDRKFQGIAEDLAARLPRARVELVPEAGHAAHLENPRAFAEIAVRFFDDVERARTASAQPGRPTGGSR